MHKLQNYNLTAAKILSARTAAWFLTIFAMRKNLPENSEELREAERKANSALQANLVLQTQLALDAIETASLAKSNFLAVMSHELRTPINAIVGYSEILAAPQSEELSVESRTSYLKTIVENANQLQSMINDILDLTRFERGTFKLVEQKNDAAEIVEAALKFCRANAEHHSVSIVAQLIEDVNVRGDLARLKQVIQNLLKNAIKFSPKGSVVNIDMHRAKGNDFVLSIRDAGIGISTEDSQRVFESFVQLEEGAARRFGGMGLGLAIARSIARLHGGDVTLNGNIGIGTEVQLTLPESRIEWSGHKSNKKVQVAA